jgi:large subunit ribosomal protein L6
MVKELVLKGVGFKAFVNKSLLYLQLGYSHYIIIKIPQNLVVKAKKQKIMLIGSETFANLIQRIKIPDPYKAVGIQVKSKLYKTKVGKKR